MNASTDEPKWLLSLDEIRKSGEYTVEELETLVFVRDLLLAPDEDENATTKTIQALQRHYREAFCPEGETWWKEKRDSYLFDMSTLVISSITSFVFEAAGSVPFTDIWHKRLADLLYRTQEKRPQGAQSRSTNR